MKQPKVAIVCDWLIARGGAERVIEAIAELFPHAPLYTALFDAEQHPVLRKRTILTSFLQKIPWALKKYQFFLPVLPYVFENFDLSEFDIVISSSHSCAKGIITKPGTLHISYCHSPMRYCWDDCHNYFELFGIPKILRFPARMILHNLRMWDRISAHRVDTFITNSHHVRARIQKYYRRDSEVIYPSVDTKKFTLPQHTAKQEGQYYLALGRLTPYKRFDLIIDTFNELKLPLLIVGTGKQAHELQKRAGRFISFLGHVPDAQLPEIYQKARALIFPQEEDFGITPLEAMACGVPVIAYGAGGALETVIPKKTGLFLKKQSMKELKEAILKSQEVSWDKAAIRAHAEQFNLENFQKSFRNFVQKEYEKWLDGPFVGKK